MADEIGVSLRSVYNDVLSQPVPDRFFDLLRQLESAGGAQFKKGAP
ncbi:NepR family anti-sigma factor [Methylocella silvestris]|nr:NepR family anti-sigma factor [Methylocella silvestris]